MSNILFILPSHAGDFFDRLRKKKIYPPIAYLMLASALEEAGFTVSIIDERVEKRFYDLLVREIKSGPYFIGFTSLTGPQITSNLRVCKMVRAIDPKIPIIWGGVHSSLLPETTIESPYIDIIVKGEGEETIIELAHVFKNKIPLTNVSGIIYKENGTVKENPDRDFVDLDRYPRPAWHLIENNIASYEVKIQTSRGCPYKCTFCYNLRFNKGRWRFKNGEKVLDEIQYLVKRFGIHKIDFIDDEFTINKKRVYEICEGLRKKNLGVKWSCDIRVDRITDDFIKTMKKSGLERLYIGVESGSQKILDFINKGITVEQIKEAAWILKKYDVNCSFSFVVGFPTETKEDIDSSIKLSEYLHSINNSWRSLLFFYTCYPGTPLYELVKKEYGFNEPSNLKGWSYLQMFSPAFRPWLKDYTFYENLQTSWWLTYLSHSQNRLLNLLIYPIKKLGEFRFRKRHFDFAPEYSVINFLKRKGSFF